MVLLLVFSVDCWCGDIGFKDEFPEIFHLARDKNAVVVEYLNTSSGNIFWDVHLTRPCQDYEVETLVLFLEKLYSVKLGNVGEDCSRWRLTKSGIFEVKLHYKALSSQHLTSFPWKSIWKALVPSKVSFFVWTIAKGRF